MLASVLPNVSKIKRSLIEKYKNMCKRLVSFILVALSALPLLAQKEGFSYKIYGQVRNDLYFNSRQNNESVDGALLSFPKPKNLDPAGEDINGVSNLNFYNMHTRLGVDVTGPALGNWKTSAKVEFDFRGSSTTLGIVRMRHAYFQLANGGSSLLVGQTWHPLNNTVTTELMNLNVGAPYQPLGRAPQIHYQYQDQAVKFRAAMIWQAQVASMGPGNTRSREYLRNSKLPELFASFDVRHENSTLGLAVHYMSIAPRIKTDEGFKTDERVNSLTLEAHGRYQKDLLTISAKSFLSQNFNQANGLGGYGVASTDPRTGKKEYAPLRISHSWLNIMYGKKWRGGAFLGYLKNLGATKQVSELVGVGTNVDQLATASAELTYNIPGWKFGVEYNYTTAWYGTPDHKGRVKNTYDVSNHRLVFGAMFMF